MSELTKEKIYKKELIVKGAKGNNNLERIRSLGGTPRLQEKTAIPSITQQIIEADEEYNGLSFVFVEGVTSEIDNNIVAENIKKDITILGVTGTYEGSGGTIENESGFGMNGNYGLVVPTDNNVYMFGKYGDNGMDNAIYKVTSGSTNITTLVATLPQAIGETTGVKVGNNIYIFGGFNEDDELYYNSILKFNIETETITTLNITLPNLMVSRDAFKIGDNVYFFGGETANGNLDIILKFNITNETITTLVATLPQTANFVDALLGGNNIYIYSLRDDITGISTLVDLRFNTTNDTLETLGNEQQA